MLKSSVPESSKNFTCKCCDYNTSRSSQYNRHVLTAKHKKAINVNTMETSFPQNNKKTTIFTCENCNKEYFSRVGLWKHKKHCVSINKEDEKESEEEDKKEYEK